MLLLFSCRGFQSGLPSPQVDLFSKSLLLVPIHLEVHWCLVAADNIKKRICLYDSQGNALQKVARVTADSNVFGWHVGHSGFLFIYFSGVLLYSS